MEAPQTVVVELTTSEAIALSWLIELGQEAAAQLVLNQPQRIKFAAAVQAADKLNDAMHCDELRCVTVGQLNDLRRLIQQDQHAEVRWLLTRMIHG